MVLAPCRFAHNETGIVAPRQRSLFKLGASSTPTARGRHLQHSVQQTKTNKGSPEHLGNDDKGQQSQLPFLQELEQRLEADLPSIGASILLALAVVLCNYGIEGLLDIFLGDSVPGDLWCMAMGPTLIALVRVSGIKTLFTGWNRVPVASLKGGPEPVPAPREAAAPTPKRTVGSSRRVVNDVY